MVDDKKIDTIIELHLQLISITKSIRVPFVYTESPNTNCIFALSAPNTNSNILYKSIMILGYYTSKFPILIFRTTYETKRPVSDRI